MKFSRILGSWVLGLVGALSAAGALYQRFPSSGYESQQVTITTAPVTIVVIPGFPIESILLGVVVGVLLLTIMRTRKRSSVV